MQTPKLNNHDQTPANLECGASGRAVTGKQSSRIFIATSSGLRTGSSEYIERYVPMFTGRADCIHLEPPPTS